MPRLTVHHLQYSQSERIPWLLTELSLLGHPIDYTLTLHQRSPFLSPPALAALHPLHAAPILQDGDLVLAESGAIVEYLIDMYGDGKLKVKAGEPGYADYIYWWHWSNSGLQAILMRCNAIKQAKLSHDHPAQKNVDGRLAIALGHLDAHLAKNEWLAGKGGFSAADVMIVFSLTTMRRFLGYSLVGYEGILGYLRRVGAREGYRESMKRADPEMDWEGAMRGEPPTPFAEVMGIKL